ncbi:Uracil-DNA glycosylase [Gemmobacter megaterium]|uniref:Uracil-DNA glycosylase n=1 Tax=Gemmobacter megaterium TaxID=1086013 RepID=A0A1N7LZK4_9RHOB|nr:uracil-DNA glycosylase [Gemmobacter megaterium]GGE09687.1 uracil-DNA glycosylase [Gemmobacter megaterium]SIS79247.1 Uracil-DNA glycosylase [Gemmobacter megaterium]
MNRPEPPAAWAHLPFFATQWPALWDRLAANPGWQPAPEAIFRALALTPPDAARVVILGQDPYHTPGRATGLAFGFPPGTPPRDSLRNILTEVATDTGHVAPSADLTGWARQGVLLLNTVLTVPVGQANGHKGWGWEPLVAQILSHLATTAPRAFLLWGAPAQKLCAKLPRDGHLFVESPHPSPLAAYRGFFGSRPFSATNRWLAAQGLSEIDWSA